MSGMHAGRPVELLLIEDNAADVRLVREGLSVFASECRLSVVSDGEAAVDYLKRRGEFAHGFPAFACDTRFESSKKRRAGSAA